MWNGFYELKGIPDYELKIIFKAASLFGKAKITHLEEGNLARQPYDKITIDDFIHEHVHQGNHLSAVDRYVQLHERVNLAKDKCEIACITTKEKSLYLIIELNKNDFMKIVNEHNLQKKKIIR